MLAVLALTAVQPKSEEPTPVTSPKPDPPKYDLGPTAYPSIAERFREPKRSRSKHRRKQDKQHHGGSQFHK